MAQAQTRTQSLMLSKGNKLNKDTFFIKEYVELRHTLHRLLYQTKHSPRYKASKYFMSGEVTTESITYSSFTSHYTFILSHHFFKEQKIPSQSVELFLNSLHVGHHWVLLNAV